MSGSKRDCEHCDGTGVVASQASHRTCWACDGTGVARLVRKRVWNERGGFWEITWQKRDGGEDRP